MNRMTRVAAAGLVLLGGIALAGCSSSNAPSQPAQTSQPAATTTATAPAAPKQHVTLYMTILDGKKDWPTFIPGNVTLPADTDIDVTIRNFDDGPADLPADNAKVQGTVGNTMTAISELTGDVDKAPGKAVSELPVKEVSHTFTINDKGFVLNVPIPPSSTVKFTFHTPAAGTYTFRCLTACGTGANGTEGAMATDGWMRGTVTIQ